MARTFDEALADWANDLEALLADARRTQQMEALKQSSNMLDFDLAKAERACQRLARWLDDKEE